MLKRFNVCGLLLCVFVLTLPLRHGALAFSQQQLDEVLMPQNAGNDAEVDKIYKRFNKEKVMRPVVLFLRAERLRTADKLQDASDLYYDIIKDASRDQYKDTWGDNGLVAFALYRWLELAENADSRRNEKFLEVAKLSDNLLQRRLVRYAYDHQYYILPKLPILEEEILHKLAYLSHELDHPKLTAKYYLNYVSRSKHIESIGEDYDLYQSIIKNQIASADRISFMLMHGMYASGKLRKMLFKIIVSKKPKTWEEFKKMLPQELDITTQYEDAQLQLQVDYWLLRATKKLVKKRFELLDIASVYQDIYQYAADEELASKALFWHALLFDAAECIVDGEVTKECGQPGVMRPYKHSLRKLVDTYEDVPRKNDAFYWLVLGEIKSGDLDAAEAWYEKLSEFDPESRYTGRIAFRIAMEHIWRNTHHDHLKASNILKAFSKRHPASRWALNALFWLGRIEEDRGDLDAAREYFEKCLSYDPYGYYGLRSWMHMLDGAASRSQLLPTNKEIKRQIQAKYRKTLAKINGEMAKNPYLKRFLAAVESGLFAAAVKGEERLRQINPSKRLNDYTSEELDDAGFFTIVATMLALRQDALAAADSIGSTTARLVIAERAGEGPNDWPLSIALSHHSAFRLQNDRAKLMQTPGYIKVSHPAVYKDLMRKVTTANGISAPILYSVMRNESFFYPAALSHAGALGLFQFTKRTFDRVDKQWNLLQDSGAKNREAYLLNKEHAFELAAKWFSDPESMIFDPNEFFMILAHHSGEHRVARWKRVWDDRGWLDDVEMMTETFRMPGFVSKDRVERYGREARGFARYVIADMIIVDLLDIYKEN